MPDADGFVRQELADGSDGVGLLDRKAGGSPVCRIGAHDGDVGAVQRRDEAHPALGDGTCQESADRVRDGVMHVEQVDTGVLVHLEDPSRQGEVVRRELQQRISAHGDAVILEVVRRLLQAVWAVVADQVNGVPQSGSVLRDVGGDHAAATDRRVADDADPEERAHPADVTRSLHRLGSALRR